MAEDFPGRMHGSENRASRHDLKRQQWRRTWKYGSASSGRSRVRSALATLRYKSALSAAPSALRTAKCCSAVALSPR